MCTSYFKVPYRWFQFDVFKFQTSGKGAIGKNSKLFGKASPCLKGTFRNFCAKFLNKKCWNNLPWFPCVFRNYEVLHFNRQVTSFFSPISHFTIRIEHKDEFEFRKFSTVATAKLRRYTSPKNLRVWGDGAVWQWAGAVWKNFKNCGPCSGAL